MARQPRLVGGLVAHAERMEVTLPVVSGFVETFLVDRYDGAYATPWFHKAIWQAFCSEAPKAAVAAPRGHAKTTAGIHAFAIATVLFGAHDFVLMIGATEDMAIKLLRNVRTELTENEDLIDAFGVTIVKDNQDELVARIQGREFCIMARGAGQKVRGLLWRQKRPGLILIDDLEDDEQVQSPDQRDKLDEWFNNALLQCGSDDAIFRMVGTILHSASQLERILADSTWLGLRFRAHADFDDFSDILWPEKFSEKRLRAIRQGFINRGKPSGYSREYLSHPLAEVDAFFKQDDFLPMLDIDIKAWIEKRMAFYVGIDFAISEKQRADFTVFVICGMDSAGMLHVVDVRRGRMGSLEIIQMWFDIHTKYNAQMYVAEEGIIQKVLGPFLNQEMMKRQRFLNIVGGKPIADKRSRATSIQARMRAGGVRFNKDAEWYPGFEAELRAFDRGIHDDQVDALAWVGQKLDAIVEALTDEEEEEQDYFEARAERRRLLLEGNQSRGTSSQTGY